MTSKVELRRSYVEMVHTNSTKKEDDPNKKKIRNKKNAISIKTKLESLSGKKKETERCMIFYNL